MTVRCYREWSTELLLKLKRDLTFQKANWERKIKEQRAHYESFLQPIGEYKSRIRDCKKHLKQIDSVLEERMKDGGD